MNIIRTLAEIGLKPTTTARDTLIRISITGPINEKPGETHGAKPAN